MTRRSIAVIEGVASAGATAVVAALMTFAGGRGITPYLVTFLVTALLSAAVVTTSKRSIIFRLTGLTSGPLIVWWLLTPTGVVPAAHWAAIAALLATNVLAVGTTVRVLERVGTPPPLATAVTALAYLIWFTMPIWSTGSALVAIGPRPVQLQPALVLNGQLTELGIWTEQPVTYTLTNLGQDTAYTLPRSVVPATAVSLVWAAFTLSVAWSAGRVRRPAERRRAGAAEPARPG